MLFELSEIYCFKGTSATRVLCQTLSFNSFRVIVYCPGHNRVLAYSMTLCVKKKKKSVLSCCLDNSDTDVDNDDDPSCFQQKEEFTFLASVYVPFPVYLVTFARNKILAFGIDEKLDLNVLINDSICQHYLQQIWPVKHSQDEAMRNTCQSTHSICTYVQKKTSDFRKGHISCVSACINSYLLVCRTDDYNKCWSVEIDTKDGKSIYVTRVSFPNDHLMEHIPKAELNPSGNCETGAKPYLVCVSTEGMQAFESEEVLTKQSFVHFFGPGALAQSNAVILFGVPDGRILWGSFPLCFPFLPAEHIPEFNLLCDISQPVCGIHVFPHGTEAPGDSLLVVGSLGKVLKLSYFPEMGNLSMQQKMRNTVLISYIPSPVYMHTAIHTSIYHISTNGQLWISNLTNNADCHLPEKKFITELVDVKGIISICSVGLHEGLLLCISSNGYMYLGDFKSLRESELKLTTTREVPCCLDTYYDQSIYLQFLEFMQVEQKALFSQMAIFTAAVESKLLENSISVSVSQLGEKYLLQISFHGLQMLKLHPFLLCLSVAISHGFEQSSLSIKLISPFCSGYQSLILESDEQFSLFASYSFFPWCIEGGLVLNISENYKGIPYFKFILSKLPSYIQLRMITVNELYFLHEEQKFLVDPNKLLFKQSETDGILTIQEIARCESSKYSNFKVCVNEATFPVEVTFHLFVATAKDIKYGGNFTCRNLFKLLVRNSKIDADHQDMPLTCIGYQIKIAVSKKASSFHILLSTQYFKLLIGLKFAVIHTLMFSNSKEESGKCVVITRGLLLKLEEMSRKILYSLFDEEVSLSSGVVTDVFRIYQLFRCEISAKLYF